MAVIRNIKSESRKNILWIILALIVAAVLKISLLVVNAIPFNSDEAVVALMARHILGGERPVFFYGQAYMGSLDAWLVAAGFWIFGQHVWVIRLVQILLYLLVILTTTILGRKIFRSWQVGVMAAWLMAVPTVNVTLYTTASLGGYGEALLIGNLLLLIGWQISVGREDTKREIRLFLWFLWGFLAGLGLWGFGITLIYAIPVGFYLIVFTWSQSRQVSDTRRQFIPEVVLLLAGGLLGAAPWLVYALNHGFSNLIWELRGGAIAGVEKLPWISQILQHLINLLLLGLTVIFGFRPPWSGTWLALPLIPFVLIFWGAVIAFALKNLRSTASSWNFQWVLMGIAVVLLGAFIFTPFGADPSGRYFVPLMIPAALFAANLIHVLNKKYGYIAFSLLLLIFVFNLWGTVQSALRNPPGITTQFYAPTQIDHRFDSALIDFLSTHGEKRGYTNYWVTYPLAFLSHESLIFVPRLPYHLDFRYTARDDRYDQYDKIVAHADQVAFITTHNPGLDVYIQQEFWKLNLQWKETQIGDYHVYYNLSRIVNPAEIGLGFSSQ
jgi:4-amino-4-deoxy-L-arabinose transferase-like glycosyltransferase